MPGVLAGQHPLVNDSTQRLEQSRHPLHFVNDDQFVRLGCQIAVNVLQFVEINRVFKVKIIGVAPRGEAPCKCGFAYLTRPQERHSRKLPKRRFELICQSSGYHACNYGV